MLPAGDHVKLKKIGVSDQKMAKNKNARFLITVNVLGSSGPLRFVVNENDSVSGVIDATLKFYAREKRLPALGSDVHSFLLYPANAGLDALSPFEAVGLQGLRNFVLCKKQRVPHMTEARAEIVYGKKSGSSSWKWKSWINKSFNFKILSDGKVRRM